MRISILLSYSGVSFPPLLQGVNVSLIKDRTLDKRFMLVYNKNMDVLAEKISAIKDSILKFVPARRIYLFGSYAYGSPTEKSDIDIYVVTPDDADSSSQIYGKIIGDLGNKKIYFIDLLFSRESVFNERRHEHIFEETIYQKGKIIYEQ